MKSGKMGDAQSAVRRGTAPHEASMSFGHQVRSYVLQPYTLAKDLRTGVEIADVHRVLDGDLDAFMEAELERRHLAPPTNRNAVKLD